MSLKCLSKVSDKAHMRKVGGSYVYITFLNYYPVIDGIEILEVLFLGEVKPSYFVINNLEAFF